MSGPFAFAYRRLRSRRLAVWLIAAVIGYSFIATLIPQVSAEGGAAVGRWQATHPLLAPVTRLLALHVAFSSPIFLLCVTLLAASTAACAWERTRRSWKLLRAGGRATEGEIARLRSRPGQPVPADVADPLAEVAASLRKLGLRIRRGPSLLEASSGVTGLLGSPVFHWALALLFVVIAAGRLTRAEGMIGLPVGYERTDTASSYGRIEKGPLFPGHSGVRLLATDLRPYKDADGVDRGVSPLLELRNDGKLERRQWVYPNNPMRFGSLLIHADDYGLAAVVSVESSQGAEMARTEQLIDFDDKAAAGTRPVGMELTGADGRVVQQLTLLVRADRAKGRVLHQMPAARRVQVTAAGSGSQTSTALAEGSALRLPGGESFRLERLVYYARISVVDDWSIYPIYVLFLIAGTAVSVSVLVPHRRVLVLVSAEGEARTIRFMTRHSRSDPLFLEQVDAAIRQAAEPSSTKEAS